MASLFRFKMIKYSILFLLISTGLVNCLQTELSVLVEPGVRECFHQYLVQGLSMETDYQVLSGGELDVTYWITSPSNRILFTDLKKQGGQFQFKTDENGEYHFCFDNSFSRFASKQVFFYISSNDQFVDPQFPAASEAVAGDQLQKDHLGELDEKLETFKETFSKVNVNLEKAQRVQNLFRAYELVDRNLMEESFERVNFWSVFNIFLMITVGVIQVYMIRSLFEDKSKIGKVLRGDKTDRKSFT